MVNPSEIVSSLVSLLKTIPDLVELLGNNSERIYAYLDIYPQNVNLQKAVHDMESPSVMVAYQDWGIEGGPIIHHLTIYMRPGTDTSYSDMTLLFVDGVPAGSPVALINASIHDDLDLMRIEGRCARQLDSEGVEFWQLDISLNEKWG